MKPVFINTDGVALEGYDVTSYWDGAPQKGGEEFAAQHNGFTYHFASADNKAKFEAEPEKFLPEYGGYCAVAMSENKIFPVNPERYLVEDGKLYLFYNGELGDTLPQWEEDPANRRVNADKFWNQ